MDYHINNVLANGIGCAKAYNLNINQKSDNAQGVLVERKKFEKALRLAHEDLDILANNSSQKDYIQIQKMMLQDKYLTDGIITKIDSGLSAYNAINAVFKEYTDSIKASASTYLNERENDFNDIKHRIIMNLDDKEAFILKENSIIIADEIFPSIFIKNQKNIMGIIVKKGGYTSHCAIMCRSLEIPYVIYDGTIEVDNGNLVLIDTHKQIIRTDLNENDYNIELNYINNLNKENSKAIKHDDYLFLANISSNEELDKVIDYEFDGVGLYRTEMIFMMSNRPYTVEEQKSIYSSAVKKLKDKYIVFRTFDIGDDKNLSYLKSSKKGIDNYKNNSEIFEDQIRAILESNIYGNVRIMFPYITSNEEFNYLRDWVLKVNNEINGNKVLIGMMLETKEAIEHILDFKNVDFISVGTNDLTYELYHINRLDGLDKVSEYIDDLLKKLSIVVDFCNKNNICFSICGELAGTEDVAFAFYKIGVKNLSVNPGAIKILNLAYSRYKENV